MAYASTHKPVRRLHRPVLHRGVVAAPKTPRAPAKPAATAVCANTGLTPTQANLDLVDVAVICLINRARAAVGLAALKENAALDRAAAAHTEDMVQAGYFDHVSPTGDTMQSRVLASGYAPSGSTYALAEDIAVAATGLDSPAQVVGQWLGDPEHRANILDPEFRDTGIAADAAMPASFGGGESGATFTQEFAALAN